MNMRLKPALRWDLKNYGKGAGVFLLIMCLLTVIFAVAAASSGAEGYASFTGSAISGTAFLLVLGIVCIRENLRMLLQNGISRRTAFLAELTALILTSFAVSGGLTLLTALAHGLPTGAFRLFAADLCQLIYWSGENGAGQGALSLGQQLISWLFGACLMLVLGLLGQMFSLLFWRLSKFWTVVAAVSIPLLLNLIPLGLYRLSVVWTAVNRTISAFFGFLGASPWNVMLVSLLASAILTGVSWLLLRRANIQAAK